MNESWDFLLLFLAGGAIGAVLGALFARQRPSARHLAEIEQLQSRVLALTAESAALQATLAREQAVSAEKLALLETARDQLANAFKAISADVLRSNNQQFLDLARTQLETFQAQARTDLETRQRRIDDSLKPIRESLDKFDVQVRDLEKNRAVAYQSMTEQVQQLMREQIALRSETSNLVGALRQPTVRGRWGEIQLRRVVELAGMLDHCDFREQHSIDSEEGKRIYARRLGIVEPVFSNICVQKRMHRFTLRSKLKVDVQWRLFALVHNIGKIHTFGARI